MHVHKPQSVIQTASTARVFSRKGKSFALLLGVQTGSRARAVSYLWIQEDISPEVKRPEPEADLSLAEVKNGGAIPPLSHTP
jgi:hypothetical protein